MNTPTDPLPEPWEWYNYNSDCWGIAGHPKEDGTRAYLAWTFNPGLKGHQNGFGDVPEGTDVWLVRSNNQIGETYEAKFATLQEATHYMAMRAMLGTWPERRGEK